MTAYYNENDPFAAEWLRQLIQRGLIAPGEVDDRPIQEVRPDDLADFNRCHFFAGIGGWDLALALAGWTDDAPVWTGSCPCQPFSVAGKGEGFDDERHLWPVWLELIAECRPPVVFGEQTSSPDGRLWLDVVRSDLELHGYAVGAADLCAAGIGAPHIRQRLWFVADHGLANSERGAAERRGYEVGRAPRGLPPAAQQRQRIRHEPEHGGDTGGRLANPVRTGRGEPPQRDGEPESGLEAGQPRGDIDGRGDVRGLGDTDRPREETQRGIPGGAELERLGGPWAGADWLPCRDGVYRPVEAGTFPLDQRLPGDVGRLRGYGNAIVPQVAAEFVMAYREAVLESPAWP